MPVVGWKRAIWFSSNSSFVVTLSAYYLFVYVSALIKKMTKRHESSSKVKSSATNYHSKSASRDSSVHSTTIRQSSFRRTEFRRRTHSLMGVQNSHYAGFGTSPETSALPLPPMHWIQQDHSVMQPFDTPINVSPTVNQHVNLAQHLKTMLKIQT